MEDALLAADQGEVGIRREAEVGPVVVGEIPLEVAHRGLLRVAHDAAKGAGQPLARAIGKALEEVRGIERENQGALVVEDAAADEVAIPSGHVEGVDGPAQTLGHDVGVRDGGDLSPRVARQVRITDVALALVGLQAQALGDLEALHQGVVAGRSPGHAWRGRPEVLDGANPHERADVLDSILPDLVHICVEPSLELLFGHASSKVDVCSAT